MCRGLQQKYKSTERRCGRAGGWPCSASGRQQFLVECWKTMAALSQTVALPPTPPPLSLAIKAKTNGHTNRAALPCSSDNRVSASDATEADVRICTFAFSLNAQFCYAPLANGPRLHGLYGHAHDSSRPLSFPCCSLADTWHMRRMCNIFVYFLFVCCLRF